MKTYTVTIAGIEHTMQLDDQDAKRLGATQDSTASTKAKTAQNKSAAPGDTK